MAHLANHRVRSAAKIGDDTTRGSFARNLRVGDQVYLFILFILLLIGWEWAVQAHWLSPLLFPAPSQIMQVMSKSLVDGSLLQDVWATVLRTLEGVILGGVPGLVLGIFAGRLSRVQSLLDPVVAAAHPVPKIAVLPLIMVFFGIGEAPKIIVAAMSAFFPVFMSARAGVQQINPIYFELARSCGARRLHLWRRVILPGSLYSVLTGFLLAINIALLVTIAVEMVSAKQGLGARIWLSWQIMRTEDLYSALLMTILLGIGLNALFRRLIHALLPWQVSIER